MNKVNFSAQKRILYVDGYEDNRLLLLYLLEHLGYGCLAVPTMTEGLALAKSGRFDLYILDTWYKDGTGLELCKRIRTFDQATPIIFFSAWTLESAREEALGAGAIAYLLKPALGDVVREISLLLKDVKSSYGRQRRPAGTPRPHAAPGNDSTRFTL